MDLGLGLCERCKKEINPARLEALPQATLCLDCKHKLKPDKGLSRVNEYWNEVMPFYNSLND
jgi:RNA polymerase-binding transcription factor DksA